MKDSTKISLIVISIIVFIAGLFVAFSDDKMSLSGVNCTVTETLVAIGNGGPVTVLDTGIRQWSIIQQLEGSTNVVSLSIGGTAVDGQGYMLGTNTTTLQPNEFRMGFSTHYPSSDAITAITNTSSTSVNVITCR